MKLNKTLLVLTLLVANIYSVVAQNIYIPSNGMPSEVVACGEPASFRFKVFGPLAAGDQLRIDLPLGVTFEGLAVSSATATVVSGMNTQSALIKITNALATASDSKLIKYKALTGCEQVATDATVFIPYLVIQLLQRSRLGQVCCILILSYQL